MLGGPRSPATLLAIILVSGTALADPTPKSQKDRQVASDMVKRAIARSEAGDHAGAIKIYLQAYALAPNALLLSNLGAEYQQDGKYAEALQYFCTYLEKDPAGTNAAYATAQARILQGQLGHKVVGDAVCATHEPASTGDPLPGGEAAGQAGQPLPEPAHPSREATPEPGGNATLRYLGIGAGITGVVALGVGAYTGYRAKDISDRLDGYAGKMSDPGKPPAPWPSDVQDLQRRGQRYEDLQIGFLIAGGVLVTAGAVLYIVGRPDAADRNDRRAIAVSPTRDGVALFGQF